MHLEVFAAIRGFGGAGGAFGSLAAALPPLTAAGFTGVEASITLAEMIPDFRSQLGEHGLDFIATASVSAADPAGAVEAVARLVDDAAFHRPRLLAVDGALGSTDDVAGLLRAVDDLADDAPFPVAMVVGVGDLAGGRSVEPLLDRWPGAVLVLDATGAQRDRAPSAIHRAAQHVAHLRVTPGVAEDSWLATWTGHRRAGRLDTSVGVAVGPSLDEAQLVRLVYGEWAGRPP